MGRRPPFETFTGATCKGCYALGTACGSCEKCKWERAQPDFIAAPLVQDSENPAPAMMELTRIGDVPMRCRLCGHRCTFDECTPDVDGEGSPGCPVPDCDGIMEVAEKVRLAEQGEVIEQIGRGVIICKE